jgi:hypothetical protein
MYLALVKARGARWKQNRQLGGWRRWLWLAGRRPGRGSGSTAGWRILASAAGVNLEADRRKGQHDDCRRPPHQPIPSPMVQDAAGNATTWSIDSRIPIRSPIAWSWWEGTSDSTRVPEVNASV